MTRPIAAGNTIERKKPTVTRTFAAIHFRTYWTPVLAKVISYAFFGLGPIADEPEALFGDTPMTIPLDSMARTLEINILEMFDEKQLPEPFKPRDFILT